MSDSSPTKRRKTRGLFSMESRNTTSNLTWPTSDAKRLPVEIFVIIASHLSRQSIQSMRLVCKEFEEKISEYLFRVVVVPFKPEIYGITPEPNHGGMLHENDILKGSIMLQDKGMRVFQGFGQHIKRFALSFEFDEDKLARPPVKSDQEAITSFWGIYRWPFKSYNRYSQLEGLEQTADETRTMAKALRFITNASELGLSVDGGLGWLAGPDINMVVLERDGSVPVFGESRFPLDDASNVERIRKAKARAARFSGTSFEDTTTSSEWSALERMLTEAGYGGADLERSVQTLLDSERLGSSTASSSSTSTQTTYPAFRRMQKGRFSNGRPARSVSTSIAAQNINAATMSLLLPNTTPNSSTQVDSVHDIPGDADAESPGQEVSNQNLVAFPVSISDDDDDDDNAFQIITDNSHPAIKTEVCPLKPNDLTNAQKEMLLEMEWAQRAFMQSYAIAIIDNPVTFQNITTLTIARLPNRHLPILRREDFWDSLPRVNKLSIAVIPDWREVVKLPTSWVQDNRVEPSQSITGVYQLLQDQISRRKNIEAVHFEWLCGGEESPGIFSRNQHVLAAPLTSKAPEMVNRRQQTQILTLPYVKHLSLKNCWISPHVILQFVSSLKHGHLEGLLLDSVSLCAPVSNNAQPNILTGHANNNHAAQNAHLHVQAVANIGVANGFPMLANLHHLQMHHAQQLHHPGQNVPPAPVVIAPPAAPQPQSNQKWFDPPRVGSWPHVIDNLTPGERLAHFRHARDLGPEPPASKPTHLKRLEFRSCGYVRLALDMDQSMFDPPDAPTANTTSFLKRMNDMEGVMMKPNDPYLGVIASHIQQVEETALENGWYMQIGWSGDQWATLTTEAAADGVRSPGQGRFSGVIDVGSAP
ncbi:hypothetical protein BP5796_11594 [Coleophoma crateriformis]|uniref:F-box domain-containing protein n=1 Tax=Coleophoma crateriformis TaxID=565419 RepID=A0A3D8QEC3_9HELO|nr:hypothetical protein BP5796_11594 [Coleophoma crateriformis]